MAVTSNQQNEKQPSKDMSLWAKCKLHPLLLRSLEEAGFYGPTPIQSQAIPAALKGRKDIFGAAETVCPLFSLFLLCYSTYSVMRQQFACWLNF